MKYSVITINYNNQSGLHSTIESVINQNFYDYEYIVIDGDSTDGSVDVIKRYASKIDYWISEKDNGIYHAMNKGVAKAHGEYCVFLNSGDIFIDKGVLSKISRINTKEDIIVGNVKDKSGKSQLFMPPTEELSLYYLYSGTVPHQGSFIKTDLLRKIPYDEQLKIVSDWKFYVETLIMHNSSIRYIDEFVAEFDTSGISTSNPDKTWSEKEKVLSDLFPPRVLSDYKKMKQSECLTQTLTSQLRIHYKIDRAIYKLGKLLLSFVSHE